VLHESSGCCGQRGSILLVCRDTSLEAARVQADVLRRLGPSRRLEIALQMSEEARSMVKARLRRQQPGLDEAGLHRALIEELYGIRIGRF
jgi:hypothetical protein